LIIFFKQKMYSPSAPKIPLKQIVSIISNMIQIIIIFHLNIRPKVNIIDNKWSKRYTCISNSISHTKLKFVQPTMKRDRQNKEELAFLLFQVLLDLENTVSSPNVFF
jgi:hypothetical protein